MSEPVGFDVFMDDALYGPEGFYARGAGAGRRGADFITSPEIGPLFGAVVANALDTWWDESGRPDPFPVVEAGAGHGALATAILAAQSRCQPALRYVTVDRAAPADYTQLPESGELGAVGVVIANELIDNLPFKIVERADDGWREVLVNRTVRRIPCPGRNSTHSSSHEFVLGAPVDVFDELDAPAGTRLPWHTHAIAWLQRAQAVFDRVHIALFDYGTRTTGELIGRDWLRTYRAHARGTDPLADPGGQDITCDVGFDQLGPDRVSTQADWLHRHGIDALVERARATWSERAAIGDLEALKARSRITESDALLDPGGMGSFLVAEWLP